MGRKRKRAVGKPFCYYCGRGFPDEKVLIMHQKARHFKCDRCHKKMATAHALLNHMYQVHKETLKCVKFAKEGRDSVELAIYGMNGVPEEAIKERREREAKGEAKDSSSEEESSEEESEEEVNTKGPAPPPKQPQQPPQQPQQAQQLPPHQMYPGMRPPMPGMHFNPMMPGMPFGMPGMPGMMPGMPYGMRPPMGGPPSSPYGAPPSPFGAPPQQQQQFGAPQSQPPATAPAPPKPTGPVEGVEEDKKGTSKVLFIFKDDISMEERRALMPKYQFQGAV